MKFIKIFVERSAGAAQEKVNKWIFDGNVEVVDFKYPLSNDDYEVVTVIYEADKPID